jgi:hypothetical protein
LNSAVLVKGSVAELVNRRRPRARHDTGSAEALSQ